MDNKKYWFFGSKLNSVLLLVLIILMVFAIRIMLQNKAIYLPFLQEKNEVVTVDNTMPKIENNEQILGNRDDLISFSIVPNTKVHGVLSYRGVIKGGYFFEGNILINVLDIYNTPLKKDHATATTDWMTAEPVSFEGNMDFTGLPKGQAQLEIRNDNASDLHQNDKSILIPIIIE